MRWHEPFGIALIEALYFGCPVFGTPYGSLPEIVEEGVQGFLVQPGDIEAHAECFLRLAHDPALRADMGRAGWQRVRDNFSIEREIARLRSILGLRE